MKRYRLYIITLILLCIQTIGAQSREFTLNLSVSSSTGESFEGSTFTLIQTDYSLTYSKKETTFSAESNCVIKVYSGNHKIIIEKEGLRTYEDSFVVSGDVSKNIALQEDIQDPYSLKTNYYHDILTGKNDVLLTWNQEDVAFFDDFESYNDFSITFGEWTGIDGDLLAAAPLAGDYENRGSLQYATIINPLTVEPAWWYDYPVLRPYSGQKYAGFVRTYSGAANDDWLISPTITVGKKNILQFMAKAGDAYKEYFEVGITTAENPTKDDFTIISAGNKEAVTYEQWTAKVYDLSKYAGQEVKIAIHYIGEANKGAFMLMVDDFYVGPVQETLESLKTKRVKDISLKAEGVKYHIYCNNTKVGETSDTYFRFENLVDGNHTLGVKSVYSTGESNIVEAPITISNANCSKVVINLSTNNGLVADGFVVELLNTTTGISYSEVINNGVITLNSLPNGDYLMSISEDNYKSIDKSISITKDENFNFTINEIIYNPYNITVDVEDGEANYNAIVKWNQDLGFFDSFEDYDDFATGSFGEWTTVDSDKKSVYPIALGSLDNIISFPGSGTATLPTAIAPMVFNPYKTVPAMAPTDASILAPTGDKTIIFFSSMQATSSKWLIASPKTIRDNYVWKLTAKAYASYPETIEMCVLKSKDDLVDYTVLDKIQLVSGSWITYSIDMSSYSGQDVILAVHYTSVDAMLTQIDDFYVGPMNENAEVNVGNILRYEVYLDNVKKGETQTPSFTFTGLQVGNYKVGVKAVYASGESELIEYNFVVNQSGVGEILGSNFKVVGANGGIYVSGLQEATNVEVYNTMGQKVVDKQVESTNEFMSLSKGIYIVKIGNSIYKVIVK